MKDRGDTQRQRRRLGEIEKEKPRDIAVNREMERWKSDYRDTAIAQTDRQERDNISLH